MKILLGNSLTLCGLSASEKYYHFMHHVLIRIAIMCLPHEDYMIQYSNQFAFGGWSWTVLSYRVQRKVITSDLGRSYLLPTRANNRGPPRGNSYMMYNITDSWEGNE